MTKIEGKTKREKEGKTDKGRQTERQREEIGKTQRVGGKGREENTVGESTKLTVLVRLIAFPVLWRCKLSPPL